MDKNSNDVRITFGIVVLNGEPFTRYNLRSLYPFAHQIIVVEGACQAAKDISMPNGHSSDGTLETLRCFKKEEDPEGKLLIIIAEDEGHPDGFWSEKDEMSKAYAKHATGNYLWQVDVDEFYKSEDMGTILTILQNDSEITAVSFKQIPFWGGFDYFVNGWLFQKDFAGCWAQRFNRLFKWGQGYTYVTHRPPTIYDAKGNDLYGIKWIKDNELIKKNIFLYHYALVFPKQVLDKCTYYDRAEWAWCDRARDWYQEVFLSLKKVYRIHNDYRYPSWLERFHGNHPSQIEELRKDIMNGKININLRPKDDIERLLNSSLYRLGKVYFQFLMFLNSLQSKLK